MSRRVTWLGHSTVLIEVGGARLLTDPVLSQRVMHLRRHAEPAELPASIDAVLLSHLHHDHADVPTLRRLPKGTRIIAPRGTGALLGGFNVQEVEVGESVTVAGAEVQVVHASHAVKRFPFGPKTPALGFVVEGVYFPGDTDLFDDMAQLAPLEIALLPVWGWGPSLGPGHLDPAEAAKTLPLLRPRTVVPIHWGTFLPYGLARRHGAVLREPVKAFCRHAERVAPEVTVIVPAIGQAIDV